ncbi:MAG: AraC family transcriptional regulator [Eubacteriales bacterium]
MQNYHVPYNEIDSISSIVLQNNLQLHACGYEESNPNSICDFRIIDDYELIYTIEGTTLITVNDHVYELHAGDIFFIQPFTLHKIGTPSHDIHTNYWVHFDLQSSTFSQPFVRMILQSWNDSLYHLGVHFPLISLYRSLNDELSSKLPGSYIVQNALFSQIFIYILRITKVTLSDDLAHKYSPIATQLLRICYDEYTSLHTASDLAKKAHISLSYCNQLFEKELHSSPARFLLNLRLKEAARLLRTTNSSISSIAEDLSFKTPYHFSTIFKKHYGLSPKYYREINFNC